MEMRLNSFCSITNVQLFLFLDQSCIICSFAITQILLDNFRWISLCGFTEKKMLPISKQTNDGKQESQVLEIRYDLISKLIQLSYRGTRIQLKLTKTVGNQEGSQKQSREVLTRTHGGLLKKESTCFKSNSIPEHTNQSTLP